MNKSLSKLTVFFLISLFLCGYDYGYIGQLPKLGETTKPTIQANKNEIPVSNIKKIEEPNLAPAPKKSKDGYAGTLIEESKYKNYILDLQDTICLLEGLKQDIEKNESNISQLFCAKVNLIKMTISNLKMEYNNKNESSLPSYKQLLKVNDSLNQTANYLRDEKNYKAVSNKSSKLSQGSIIQQKIKNSLEIIDNTLKIMKDDSSAK